MSILFCAPASTDRLFVYFCRMEYLSRVCISREQDGTWKTPALWKLNQCNSYVQCQRFISSQLRPREEANEVGLSVLLTALTGRYVICVHLCPAVILYLCSIFTAVLTAAVCWRISHICCIHGCCSGRGKMFMFCSHLKTLAHCQSFSSCLLLSLRTTLETIFLNLVDNFF